MLWCLSGLAGSLYQIFILMPKDEKTTRTIIAVLLMGLVFGAINMLTVCEQINKRKKK